MKALRVETVVIFLAVAFVNFLALPQSAPVTIAIDRNAPAQRIPHFWERMFGSGRAVTALRDNCRRNLKEVHDQVDASFVRCRAIFNEQLSVYVEDENGNPVFNFSNVDQISDGRLTQGVRPFIEISLMPRKLCVREAIHPFRYKQNVAPPKDYAKWDQLIHAFAQHLLDRYGFDDLFHTTDNWFDADCIGVDQGRSSY